MILDEDKYHTFAEAMLGDAERSSDDGTAGESWRLDFIGAMKEHLRHRREWVARKRSEEQG